MSSKTKQPDSGWTGLLLATFAVAMVLRAIGLDSGLWYDEIVTLVTSARNPVGQIVTEFSNLNAHPLYSVLAHASLETFGEDAWSLRLPAAIFGVASVAMAYVLASKLTTPLEAWSGAAVLATSYHHIWFSQNARGYTLMSFLALATTLLLLRIRETDRGLDHAWYALAATAGVYTHLTMVFVIAGHAVGVLGGQLTGLASFDPRTLRRLCCTFATAGLLSALAYAPFVSGLLATINAEAPHKAAEVATASWAIGEAIRSLLSGAGMPAALIGGLFVGVGAVSLCRRQPFATALLIVPGVLTGLGILVLGQPLRPRFFFFLSAAAGIFLGRGVGAVVEMLPAAGPGKPRTIPVLAFTAVLIGASLVSLPRNYRVPKQDFDGAARFLADEQARGAHVVASGPACWPFTYYYGKEWPCVLGPDDWQEARAQDRRVLVAYTLSDYIEDAAVRSLVRSQCATRRVFPGTVGQGDITVCEMGPHQP